MSIASQCSDCCECPTATVQFDSASLSFEKCGFDELPGFISSPPKVYKTATITGVDLTTSGPAGDDESEGQINGSFTYDVNCQNGCATEYIVVGITATSGSASGSLKWFFASANNLEDITIRVGITAGSLCEVETDYYVSTQVDTDSLTASSSTSGTYSLGGSVELSNEYTTTELIDRASSQVSGRYQDVWSGGNGFRALDSNEKAISVRGARYRLRFRIPQVRTGKAYRVDWVDRFLPEGGVSLTSIAVRSPGKYRPTVDIGPPPPGGTQAFAVAVMSLDGEVASIRILHPGSGYLSVPTVTVEAATMGGVTAIGWVATLSPEGQVSAITGGTGGDYLPAINVIGSGGSGAAASAIMDEHGGISSVTVDSAGSGYSSFLVSAEGVFEDFIPADLLPSFGTEITKNAIWDGTTLAGRWCVRNVSDGGHALTSIEVVHGGTYLPTVSFTGGGGTGATAVVSGFSSTGTVTAITVTNGGSGYTSAPTVVITRRSAGGSVTNATATASVSGGAVTSVSVTTAGSYLPTLTISGGGGSGATGTVVMANDGSIASITLTAPGSGFLTNPLLRLSYYGTETILLAAHFASETEYADGTEPPGAVPVGYVDGEVRTYPILGDTGTAPWRYFEIGVPAADGLQAPANVRATCVP